METADGSPVSVSGAGTTTSILGSDYNTVRNLAGTANSTIILYGDLERLVCNENKLTELACDANKLTTLDVSNNAKLVYLICSENQLDAAVFTALLKILPDCSSAYEPSECILYRNVPEEKNCKDFTSVSAPQALKDAVQAAKDNGWILKYYTGSCYTTDKL